METNQERNYREYKEYFENYRGKHVTKEEDMSATEKVLREIIRKSPDIGIPTGRDNLMLRFGMILNAIHKTIDNPKLIYGTSLWIVDQTTDKLHSLFEEEIGIQCELTPKKVVIDTPIIRLTNEIKGH